MPTGTAPTPTSLATPRGHARIPGFPTRTTTLGVELAKRIWMFNQRFHPKTKVMVSGVRSRDDALALAGVDFLVAGPKVLGEK